MLLFYLFNIYIRDIKTRYKNRNAVIVIYAIE
jgi:hypothetical protein